MENTGLSDSELTRTKFVMDELGKENWAFDGIKARQRSRVQLLVFCVLGARLCKPRLLNGELN